MSRGEDHSGDDEEGGSGRQIIAREKLMYCVIRFHRLSAIWTGHVKLASAFSADFKKLGWYLIFFPHLLRKQNKDNIFHVLSHQLCCFF